MGNFLKATRQPKFKRVLIVYSIILMGLFFFAQIILLFANPVEAVVVNRNYPCSGAAGSGTECNALGYPQNVNHMFGCYASGGGYSCFEVPANDNNGLPGCFLDTDGQWKNCGCDIAACENTCRANYANQPGFHVQGATCNNCGQHFTCGCNIAPTETPTTTPTNTPPTCPSTQARFTIGSRGLVSGGTYNIAELPPFQYSVLINGDVNQRFQGNVTLSGPFGSLTQPNGNTRDVPQPWTTGGYTLVARLTNGTECGRATVSFVAGDKLCTRCTPGQSDGNACETTTVPSNANCPSGYNQVTGNQTCASFQSNNQCPVVTVTPTPPSGITIDKAVPAGSGPYQVGAEIRFRITITNTGQTTYTSVYFRDQYNQSRLDFLRIINAKNNQNITGSFNVNEQTGAISINDITTVLGDLAPGQNYQIDMYFTALAPTSTTCNDAFIIPEAGKPEMGDQACVSINQTPPPTDL